MTHPWPWIVEDRPWSMRPRFGRLTGALRDARPDPYYTDQKRFELEDSFCIQAEVDTLCSLVLLSEVTDTETPVLAAW